MTEANDKGIQKKEKEIILKELNEQVCIAANYCYNCNRCVNVCPMSHLGVFFPRNLITDLSSSPIEEVLKNYDIWKCLTCGQCSIYCPMTKDNVGVRIPELVLELRKLSKVDDTQLDKIAKCETHDDIFPLIAKIMAENPLAPNKLDFLENTHLKTTDSGEIAYFVGCLPLMEDILINLNGNYKNIPKTIISLLNDADIKPVVLNEKCCGHDILWGKGDVETFKKLAEYNVNLYREAGVKKIIVACAEGYRTWKIDYPKFIKDFDFEVFHFSEFFLNENILKNIRVTPHSKIKVTYHDACRIGRLGGKLYDAPRDLIKQLPGVELVEMENIKDDANCCGVSAFMGCNEYTRILRQNRIEEALKTGAEYLIVPCPKCLTHFNCYINEPSLDEEHKKIKEKIEVIDLANFIGRLYFLV